MFCYWTHIVEDVHPSFHGDTLENGENSKKDVVKIGDTKVGSNPVFPTDSAVATGPCRSLQATGEICCQLIYSQKYTQLHTVKYIKNADICLFYLYWYV